MSQTGPSDPAPQGDPAQIAARRAKSFRRTAALCVFAFLVMVGGAFASVPFYRVFCQATGFDGATRRAETASSHVLDRTMTVRFDANVRGLPWDFKAEQVSQTVKVGATGLAFFKVTNTSDKPLTGRAIYNVVPELAGPYFQKLECFCFKDQTLQPGQTADFPVVYFIDPRITTNYDTRDMREVTLSYSFFPSTKAPPVAKSADAEGAKGVTPLGGTPRQGYRLDEILCAAHSRRPTIRCGPWTGFHLPPLQGRGRISRGWRVMAHDGVKHDYHLVNPSPWPFVGSMSAAVMAIGGVIWMKGLFGLPAHTPWIFFLGLAGVLYTMVGWWMDVIKEANAGDHTPVVALGLRYGMILFIASEVMFFVAWFWIFFEMSLFHHHRTLSAIEEVRTAWQAWPPAGVETVSAWHLPLVNTLTLLLSGTTVTWSHHALQQGDRKGAKIGLVLTVLLGMMFTGIQAYEYHHIIEHHLFFNENASATGLYGSTFFMATGFHGFHVLIGTIFLLVCLIRMMNGAFTPKQHFGFEAAAWYWHFVDVVWLFLFAFVYVVFG